MRADFVPLACSLVGKGIKLRAGVNDVVRLAVRLCMGSAWASMRSAWSQHRVNDVVRLAVRLYIMVVHHIRVMPGWVMPR